MLAANRRALGLGIIAGTVLACVGVYLMFSYDPAVDLLAWWIRKLGILLMVIGLLMLATAGVAWRRPRVAYGSDHLLLDLQYGVPIRVPLDVVECFFLGQGPSFLGRGKIANAEAANVVVRLAERAKEWHQRDIKPHIGNWCDGYITIRGAGCEPINGQVVERMNARLAAIKRERKRVEA